MDVVLGISARANDVTAALVDPELPQLGPVEERVTNLRPGTAIGDVVATAVGVMMLLAERNDLVVQLVTIAYETEVQRNAILRALEAHQISGIGLIDAASPQLDSSLSTAVAAAVWGAEDSDAGEDLDEPLPVVAPVAMESTRRGLALVAGGIAAAVVAGGVAVWAVAGTRTPEATGATTPPTSQVSTSAPTTTTTTPAVLPPVVPTTTSTQVPESEIEDPQYVEPEYIDPQSGVEPESSGEQPQQRPRSTTATRAPVVVPTTRAPSAPSGGGGGGGGSNKTTAVPTVVVPPVSTETLPDPPIPTDPATGAE